MADGSVDGTKMSPEFNIIYMENVIVLKRLYNYVFSWHVQLKLLYLGDTVIFTQFSTKN